MSDTLNAKGYLALLKKSRLVDDDRLKPSISRLAAAAKGKPVVLEALSRHFLDEGLLTEWQNEQLLKGKHKGFFLGQYCLLKLLGAGGMSAVYLAEQSITGQRRAIKILPRSRVTDKSYLERFYLEGRAAASLHHPRIAQIVDLANDEDVHYMVMEYVEGIDLDRYVKEKGRIDCLTALKFLEQTAEGLAHAHSRNIIHRDIKPANLMVTDEGQNIKLLDLGLALFSNAQESLTVMHDEKVMGTADYLSPEQAIDSHRVDPRTDIYSLGCTFYFMLTGHPPFPDGSIAQRIAKHQNAEPEDLSSIRRDCPVQVARLCQKMMKKKPEERFASCEALVEAVRKIRTSMELQQSSPASVVPEKSLKTGEAPSPPKGQADSNRSVTGKAEAGVVNIEPQKLGELNQVAMEAGSIMPTVDPREITQALQVSSPVSARRGSRKTSISSVLIFGGLIGFMFVVLLIVLLFLAKFMSQG